MAAPHTFYDLAQEDRHWANPNASYAAIAQAYGGGANADQATAKSGVLMINS